MSGAPVGVVGLGVMGLPMARRLRGAGFEVLAWNRSDRPAQAAAAAGIELVADPAELGRRVEVVLVVLPDLPQLREVLAAGLTGEGSRVRVLVVASTVSPGGLRELAAGLPGVDVVDAPVSGGSAGAAAGTLSVMVGGPDAAVARVRPLLDAVGATVRHLGPTGAGEVAKACNQLVVAATLTGLAEAVLTARRGGVDPAAVLDLLAAGLGSSAVLAAKRDLLLGDDFAGDGPAGFLVKDLAAAAEAAGGDPLPLTALLRRLFGELTEAGLGELDNSVVLRWLSDGDGRSGLSGTR